MPDSETADYWSTQAESFDDEQDHGLTDPETRREWAARLSEWLPPSPCRIADIGCGTGSLSVLAAQMGHDVVGLDFSSAMIERATSKALDNGLSIEFQLGDASNPPLPAGSFDVVLTRHVIWTLPDPKTAMALWADLLKRDGRIIAVEGVWGDTGITAEDLTQALRPHFSVINTISLSSDSLLWGKDVDDDRYAVICSRPTAGSPAGPHT